LSKIKLEKLFETKRKVASSKEISREYDDFTNNIIEFGSGDIQRAVELFNEIDKSGYALAQEVKEWSDSTGTPINKIDIVLVAYEYILQNARNEIDDVLKIDIQNDLNFETSANYCATSFDWDEKSIEKLKEKLENATNKQLKKLSSSQIVKTFLEYVEVFE